MGCGLSDGDTSIDARAVRGRPTHLSIMHHHRLKRGMHAVVYHSTTIHPNVSIGSFLADYATPVLFTARVRSITAAVDRQVLVQRVRVCVVIPSETINKNKKKDRDVSIGSFPADYAKPNPFTARVW